MSSKSTANLILFANLGSEMVYILNNRIKSLDIVEQKRNSILCQIARNLYQGEEYLKMISDSTSLMSLEGLHNLLNKICHKSVITLDPSSFGKMIEMVLMALKKDVLLMKNDFGLRSVTINHFEGVDKIVKDRSITEPMRKLLEEHFSRMGLLDYSQVKRDILNLLIFKHSKISIYLKDEIQENDAHFIIRPPNVAGFNVNRTGAIFDGAGAAEGVINGIRPVSSSFRIFTSFLEEGNDRLGDDLFEGLKKNEIVTVTSNYIRGQTEDMSAKILGSSLQQSKLDNIEMEMEFGEGEIKLGPGQNSSGDGYQKSEQFQAFNSSISKKNKAISLMDDDQPTEPKKQEKQKDLLDMMDEL